MTQIIEIDSGTAIDDAIAIARGQLTRRPDHDETLRAIDRAVAAAHAGKPNADTVEELGGGWIAEEALSIGLYCALTASTFEEGVLLAVNHGGDSDSTGSIAGNLLGLMHGEAALPARWLQRLELRGLIVRVAEDLIDCPDFRSISAESPERHQELSWDIYPTN